MKLYYLATAVLLTLSFAKLQAQTVYITESGKKYHTKDCPALKASNKKGIDLKEALKQGYSPCKPCGADAVVVEEKEKAKKSSGKS